MAPNKQNSKFGSEFALMFAIVAIILISSNANNDATTNYPTGATLAELIGQVKLTRSLVMWIGTQAENMVEEMDEIAKQNARSDKFSLVNYLRYLTLYEQLSLIASKRIETLEWVGHKVRIFSKVNKSAVEILFAHLSDLDKQLSKLEQKEKPGKQVQVKKEWKILYETIDYIANYAPTGSKLAEEAHKLLIKSPDDSVDKVRKTRFNLAITAFNRR